MQSVIEAENRYRNNKQNVKLGKTLITERKHNPLSVPFPPDCEYYFSKVITSSYRGNSFFLSFFFSGKIRKTDIRQLGSSYI
jgi:hypothetical protein